MVRPCSIWSRTRAPRTIRVMLPGSRLTLRRAMKVTLSRALARSMMPWMPRITLLNVVCLRSSSRPCAFLAGRRNRSRRSRSRGRSEPGCPRRQRAVERVDEAVGASAGGVVFEAGADWGNPDRPAVRAEMTWTLPPWCRCFPDHQSEPGGPRTAGPPSGCRGRGPRARSGGRTSRTARSRSSSGYLRGAGTAGGCPCAWIVTQASGTPRKQVQLTSSLPALRSPWR